MATTDMAKGSQLSKRLWAAVLVVSILVIALVIPAIILIQRSAAMRNSIQALDEIGATFIVGEKPYISNLALRQGQSSLAAGDKPPTSESQRVVPKVAFGITGLTLSPPIEGVSLAGTQAADVDAGNIANLPGIRFVDISARQLTEQSLRELRGVRGLRTLALNSSQIDHTFPDRMEELAGVDHVIVYQGNNLNDALNRIGQVTRVTHLTVVAARLGDPTVQVIRKFTHLDTLRLKVQGISGRYLEELRLALKDTEIIQ